jgi:hypothetical protein
MNMRVRGILLLSLGIIASSPILAGERLIRRTLRPIRIGATIELPYGQWLQIPMSGELKKQLNGIKGLRVRRYLGTKEQLANPNYHTRNGTCVVYATNVYHVKLNNGLDVDTKVNESWLLSIGTKYLVTNWVLILEESPSASEDDMNEVQIVEGDLPQYFGGGVEVSVVPPDYLRPQQIVSVKTSTGSTAGSGSVNNATPSVSRRTAVCYSIDNRTNANGNGTLLAVAKPCGGQNNAGFSGSPGSMASAASVTFFSDTCVVLESIVPLVTCLRSITQSVKVFSMDSGRSVKWLE